MEAYRRNRPPANRGQQNPRPRLIGEVAAMAMIEACAHLLLDEIGEDAFIDALRARGYVVTEAE